MRRTAAWIASSREFVPMSSNVFLSREPWKRSIRIRSATSSSVAATSPPSPSANRFFVGKKLKVEATPVVAMPVGAERLGGVLDQRQAERGELGERRGPAEEVHGHDRLRAAASIRRSTSSGSRFSVTGSMSAKTGVAPTRAIASAVA